MATSKRTSTRTAKAPAKAPVKAAATPSDAQTQHNTHPPWVDMIKECIIAHPEDARNGVSRPTIKKFVATNYKVNINATAASQLSRAITHGAESGVFVLPKGISGKVKLPPRHLSDASKENDTVAPKKPTSVKGKSSPAKASTSKESTISHHTVAPKNSNIESKKVEAGPTKKYTSSTKKGQIKRSTATAKQAAADKKAPAKKASSRQKVPAKKAVVGSVHKKTDAPKSRAKSAATKAKAVATKGRRSSRSSAATGKTKPTSKK